MLTGAMGRVLRAAAIVVLALAPIGARAQFDSIFGPLRPPGNVPNAGRPQGDAPPQPPANPSQSRPGTVQARPLPPPPGVNVDPGLPPPNQATLSPPGQRQPRAGPQPDPPPPPDEIVEPPAQRIANKNALFSGLDKITGRVINFDTAIGETVQFGALQVTVRACYTRPPTETANTDAFVEVDEVTLQGEVKRIFTGWMFAASPGLHGVEHPIYDVWLTDCKSPVQTAAAAPDPAPPAQPPRPPAPSPKSAQPQPKRPPAPPPQPR
jgi:hypothetical protein